MSRFAVSATLLLALAPGAAAQQDPHMALALKVLRTTPLIDGHNDLPGVIRDVAKGDVEAYDLRKPTPGHTDLARLREGHLGGQFWSVYISGSLRDSGYARIQLEQIDIGRRLIDRYPEAFQWATTADGMRQAFAAGRIGSVLGLEGGHAIENSLGALRAYYDLGARYMTLTHNVTLDWADAANDVARHGGLSRFGEEVVREMNRLGMLVDLSHVSPASMSDALNVTAAPVIFSHSGARALTNHPRNVPDSILRRMPANGGVVMVPFVTFFMNEAYRTWDTTKRAGPKPAVRLADVADHIDHIRKVAGVDHVGIGADFDGITEVIPGLEDVASYPRLFAELARRGWTESDLGKLAGENVLRAMAEAEVVSMRLRRERAASTATIEQLDGVRGTK